MFLIDFGSIMAQFELTKHKFPNQTLLYVHLCIFQITLCVAMHNMSTYHLPASRISELILPIVNSIIVN